MIPMEYSSFSSLFAALGMATTSSPAAQPVADFSKPQNRGVSKKCRPQRMIYGFTFSPDQLEDWGRQHFGDTGDEKVLERYIKKSMGRLYYPCYHRWRRTTKHFVTYYTGPRRHEEDWCLTLADNISCDTVMPPPREIIDEIKDVLDLTRDPEWHLFYGD